MTVDTTLVFDLLSVADAPLLADVARRAYTDHYLHLWHDGGAWYMERCFTPAVLQRELDNSNARFYLVRQQGQAVGFFKLNLDQPLKGQETVNAMELERIYLSKDVTGQGIGKAVLTFVVDYARQLGKELIWLKAMDTSHDAIAFYERMGFVVCGTDRLTFDVMKEDVRGMVVMRRPL
ncbi:GNAT family N-acetyltransferase [Fibrisoma montanum]|uniref:GNAT family N-acetyltransferase n=1 Tax=Fibrisoma montanum TaxID=2305895 RepID=A0A418MB35_9BACT|nr:GNAT family N-acetyltransferase [Fibrisoma montanum]RIV23585.1 GNAT family N-acetyltransferase [Fibrisoma montanum]